MVRYFVGLWCLVALTVSCSSNSDTARTPREAAFQGQKYVLENVHHWEEKRNQMGTDCMWLSPQEGADDTFRENLNVTVEVIPDGMNMDEYIRRSVENLAKLGITANAEYEPTTVNGLTARVSHINHVMGAFELALDSYVILDGTHAYVISCTATQASYGKYREKFEEMLETFSLAGDGGI